MAQVSLFWYRKAVGTRGTRAGRSISGPARTFPPHLSPCSPQEPVLPLRKGDKNSIFVLEFEGMKTGGEGGLHGDGMEVMAGMT